MHPDKIKQGIAELGPWFYPFDFGGGMIAPLDIPPQVAQIHHTRLAMLEGAVASHFGAEASRVECLDIGCHEGYFALAMARRTRRVTAIDAREENIRRARFVAEATDAENIGFRQGRVETLWRDEGRQYALTLFLGVLYHVEDPMLCLRQVAAVTGDMCVIETQVVDEVDGFTEWGSMEWKHPYQGILALIDESHDFTTGVPEAGVTSMATCPSPRALLFMLRQAGFARVEMLTPPPASYEQHARGKRVMCAAYKAPSPGGGGGGA